VSDPQFELAIGHLQKQLAQKDLIPQRPTPATKPAG
jgi:hypothetical protein